jgi:hypothetical protein
LIDWELALLGEIDVTFAIIPSFSSLVQCGEIRCSLVGGNGSVGNTFTQSLVCICSRGDNM